MTQTTKIKKVLTKLTFRRMTSLDPARAPIICPRPIKKPTRKRTFPPIIKNTRATILLVKLVIFVILIEL